MRYDPRTTVGVVIGGGVMGGPAYMGSVAPFDRQCLAAFFERYDVGKPQGWRAALHGIENNNYFVTTLKDGRPTEWVLTLLERPSYSESGYVALLDLCHAAGLPVAPVVRNARREPWERLLGKRALLAPKLPGEHVGESTLAQVEALGRLIAEFHLATANPPFRLADYPRDRHWLQERCAAIHSRMAPADEQLLIDGVAGASALLNRGDLGALPIGIVHGDLFRDNILFQGNELTGMLDFHHAARGYLVYDLAVAVNDWCNTSGGAPHRDRVAALVGAYHRVRPLTVLEQRLFADFLLYAGVAFWLSRLVVAMRVNGAPPSRYKDPDEFKTIVAHRRERRFRLDFLDAPR